MPMKTWLAPLALLAWAVAAPAAEVPRLRLGVVSDIHCQKLAEPGEDPFKVHNTATFEHALGHFREIGVDAVVIPGDLANLGLISEMEDVAKAWFRVFPGDRGKDGRKVERIIIYGNHDMGGYPWVRGRYKTEDEARPFMLLTNREAAWERIWGEKYEPVFIKDVKGYKFVGAHWCSRGCTGRGERFNPYLAEFYGKHADELKGTKPFFHVQHPHPKDTCYGPWAWGYDEGLSTAALSQFPNAIALSGHSHYTPTDDRSVWQGAFTSIGCGCLRYQDIAGEEFAATGGFENGSTPSSPKAKELNAAKLMSKLDLSRDRTGLVMEVYDDRLVIERRDFVNDMKLGDDWVVPLPAGTGGPMDFAVRKSKAPVPRFAADAKIERTEGWSSCRGSKEKLAVKTVSFPAAVASDGTRAYRYVIRITDAAGGSVAEKNVAAPDFCRAKSFPNERISCPFAAIPSDARITVTPYNVFGASGPDLN